MAIDAPRCLNPKAGGTVVNTPPDDDVAASQETPDFQLDATLPASNGVTQINVPD